MSVCHVLCSEYMTGTAIGRVFTPSERWLWPPPLPYLFISSSLFIFLLSSSSFFHFLQSTCSGHPAAAGTRPPAHGRRQRRRRAAPPTLHCHPSTPPFLTNLFLTPPPSLPTGCPSPPDWRRHRRPQSTISAGLATTPGHLSKVSSHGAPSPEPSETQIPNHPLYPHRHRPPPSSVLPITHHGRGPSLPQRRQQ
jgi:hypothetical protein